ncbi:hypothetical protein TNCV_2944011 [Trichonephila clavipes]|nr:hypothetical protein TNCV_2944011 [Trichonephila clavipes]
MRECLSSIKHVVGVRSVFLAKRLHVCLTAVKITPSCCLSEMAHNQSVRRYLDALPEVESLEKKKAGVTSVAAEFGIAHSIVSPEVWRQFQTTGTATRGSAFSVVPEHRNCRDNEWGRVLFTDESRFSLSSDSQRIYSSGESRGSHNHPSEQPLKGTGMEVAVPSLGEASCLMRYGSAVPFMDDNAPCHRTVAAEQLLESEDIERMDWPARSLISIPSSMYGIFWARLATHT